MQKVNLDLVPGGVNPIVYASQHDNGRTIRFQLVSGGDEWTLSGNETITAKITKPDGTAITIPITNPGSGKHYVDLVNGASDYDQDGVYVGEVSIVKGSKTIGTGNFVLKVEADAYDAGVKILTASGNPAAFNTDLADILADCTCELPYNSNGYKSATVINTSNTAVENETPYQLRQTPITANRCLEKLIGVSCAFNQLVNTGDTSINTTSGHKYVTKINNVWSIISGGSAVTIVDDTSDMVIDLTACFGSEVADYFYTLESNTAGAGVALFRQLFPEDYYAYQTATLMSAKPVSKKVVGFNQWDEEWELGGLDSGTGATWSTNDRIRCKNYIPIKENTDYFWKSPAYFLSICYYDENKQFISGLASSSRDVVKTTPNGAFFCKLGMASNYGTTYNHDICINFSDPEKNGTYEPYKETIYNLGGDELRGLLKVENGNLVAYGDIKPSDGNGTEVFAIVDLGTLPWVKVTNAHGDFFSAVLGANPNSVANARCLCALYQTSTAWYIANTDIDKAIGVEDTYMYIRDSAYNDATAFTNALDGVYLIYEKSTPTAKSYTPFTNPMISGSTEEFTDTRSVKMPCGHDSYYGNDLTFAKADFGQTIYGGSIDFTTGTLISNKNADGTDKTPETISITPVQVTARSGDNKIITDANGTNTVKYYKGA